MWEYDILFIIHTNKCTTYIFFFFVVFLLLILQSFDWLAAFHLELLQAIFFIAV